MSVNKGKSVEGKYQPNCRTQMTVKLDDYDHYINTVLGCHQVITFEDITDRMKQLCKLLGITVI